MPASYHAIAAMATNRVIGKDGTLPWHCKEDLQFFKKTTLGHPIIMGRKTWNSLGRPLPGRRHIVISRTLQPSPGIEVLRSPADLPTLGLEGDAFIIGGAEIYRELLPHCASLYLTIMPFAADGDALMPPFEAHFPHTTLLAETPSAKWVHYSR